MSAGSYGGALIDIDVGSNIDATAKADVDTSIKANATVRAGTAVDVVSRSSNNAKASFKNISGALLTIKGGADITAESSGKTTASILGNIIGTDGMSAGASSINLLANGVDFADARIEQISGGIAAIDVGNSATSSGTPTITATLGGGSSKIRATFNINAQALSTNDSDATGTSISGGLLRISVGFNVNASMSPTVSAVVTGGAQITAGGTLTLDATSNQPLPPISDGTFDAGHVNGTTNTITFHCNGTPCIHNAGTGDVVTYDNRGGSQISPDLAGRSIGVIVTGPTTIQLGTVFDADGSDATGSVSATKDYIDYGNRPHLLETGDIVIYSGNIPGLTNGNAYRVFKVDDTKFKLQDTTVSLGTVEVSGDCGTSSCINNGLNRIVVSNTFKNGDFVTYHAPPAVVTFGSTMVDVDLNGNDGFLASCTRAVTGSNAGANNIFVAKDEDEDGCLDDSGLSTGQAITYIASDPAHAIGGLDQRVNVLRDRAGRVHAAHASARESLPRRGQGALLRDGLQLLHASRVHHGRRPRCRDGSRPDPGHGEDADAEQDRRRVPHGHAHVEPGERHRRSPGSRPATATTSSAAATAAPARRAPASSSSRRRRSARRSTSTPCWRRSVTTWATRKTASRRWPRPTPW